MIVRRDTEGRRAVFLSRHSAFCSSILPHTHTIKPHLFGCTSLHLMVAQDATWTSNPTRAPPKAARGGRAGIDDDARGGLREPAAEECVGGDTSSDSTRYTPDLEEEPPVEKAGDRKRAKDADSEVIWVEWDDKDPENPFEWTLARRWRITLISCLFSFVSCVFFFTLPLRHGRVSRR